MPKNLKQELFFTGMMAGMMVLIMSEFNSMRVNGINQTAIIRTLIRFPLGLLVAGFFDLVVVGPIVKAFVFKVVIKDPKHTAPLRITLTISLFMVLGMITLMTAYGLIVIGQFSWPRYGMGWLINLVVAIPVQLLIVGPLARRGLTAMQKK